MATVHEVDTRLVGYRPAVSGRHWAVSSGHSLATLAAQRILSSRSPERRTLSRR
ncbi:MAG: hypothetical protein ACRERE_13415 [Candidatus Entotheonellia bacterium]